MLIRIFEKSFETWNFSGCCWVFRGCWSENSTLKSEWPQNTSTFSPWTQYLTSWNVNDFRVCTEEVSSHTRFFFILSSTRETSIASKKKLCLRNLESHKRFFFSILIEFVSNSNINQMLIKFNDRSTMEQKNQTQRFKFFARLNRRTSIGTLFVLAVILRAAGVSDFSPDQPADD